MDNLKSESKNSVLTFHKGSSTSRFLNRIQIISLNTLILNIIITILQIYLIFNRVKLLNDLTSSYSQKTSSIPILSNQQKLNNSVIINIFLLTFSILFTIAHALTGSLRLRIYSHDGFKIGQNFDDTQSKLDIYSLNGSSFNRTACSSSLSSEDTSQSVSISKQKLTQSSTPKSSYECGYVKPGFWKELPPLGVIFHLLSALILLIAEVQLSSRRIQLGNKPIGDIFSSKLDFFFGEPINRLKIFRSNQDLTLITSSMEFTTLSPNQDNIQEVINSRDDFSVFGHENPQTTLQLSSLVFIVAANTISLDYLNFLIALICFIIKTSQTFWSSSKRFTLLVLFFNVITLFLMSISFCSFEILFKSNNLKVIAKNFLFFHYKNEKRQESSLSGINLIEDYGHDMTSTFLYLLSSFILFVNIYFITKFGYRCFNKERVKFEKNISIYIRRNFRELESVQELNEKNFNESSLDKTDSVSNTTPKSHCDKSSSSFNTSLVDSKKLCKHPFSFSYRENIISSILFLLYCILRSMFIYEIIIIFKFTNDSLILTTILVEIIVILGWIISLICLTFKENWKFSIHSNYKVLFWNHVYNINKLKCSFVSSDKYVMNTSINSRNVSNEVKSITKNVLPEKSTTQTETIKNASEATKTPGLLVRDDSVLNRSSYLSSSSITEVSSLMPSTFANLPKLPSQHNINQKLGSLKNNVLNPSSLISSTIMNERNIVMINDDESSNDDTSIQPLRVDHDFYNSINENSHLYSQIKKNNVIDDENDDFMNCVQRRSYSYRPSGNRNSTLSNNSLKKSTLATSNSGVSTVGEIMEENSNQNKYVNMGKNSSVSIIHKTLNIIDSSSSSATVDSGRESITESPVSNLNNPNLRNESNLLCPKYKAQTVQLKQMNQPLDTNC